MGLRAEGQRAERRAQEPGQAATRRTLSGHTREPVTADPRRPERREVTTREGSFLFLPPLASRQHLPGPPGRPPWRRSPWDPGQAGPPPGRPSAHARKPHALRVQDAGVAGAPFLNQYFPHWPPHHRTCNPSVSKLEEGPHGGGFERCHVQAGKPPQEPGSLHRPWTCLPGLLSPLVWVLRALSGALLRVCACVRVGMCVHTHAKCIVCACVYVCVQTENITDDVQKTPSGE